MPHREVRQLVPAQEITEGAGVTVHRTLGTPALRNLDPFLLLDHFSSDNPDDYIAGFPDHPHRGFVTFTYMLDGHMLHRDSMGNQGDLQAGGAQWMKAAGGVIHSEMPQQTAGLMRGFQLWINLPAGEKLSAPAYQEFSAEAFPVYREAGMQVKVLSGEYAGLRGPVEDPHTQVQYLDVTLAAGRRFEHELTGTLNAFVYVFEGTAEQAGTHLPRHTLAVPGKGETLTLEAGSDGARFILVAGRPIGEPIAQYGPFVMNTQEEIHQAMRDYRDGRLVQQRAEVRGE
ncbi:pirin family protein [Thiohalobacter thiocyanaticus]|uniref:Pirin family protein n=1 Tax=Thiohalobacter thiocyanaticus TaxID=585455 RepID=A0A426QLZ0_9GAMM|nr:pirin family protein [Thiohalobacter thiocyanaticus]RRQ22765.1 pirin family protein [Thiohalobacter thiocyanaticus]